MDHKHELFNSVTMFPGLLVSYIFANKWPGGCLAYSVFCLCSALYHWMNWKRGGVDWKKGFALDIASQHVACAFNTASHWKKGTICGSLTALTVMGYPREASHLCSGLMILLATGLNTSALMVWVTAFGMFGISRVAPARWRWCKYLHGVFHVLAHAAMWLIWRDGIR